MKKIVIVLVMFSFATLFAQEQDSTAVYRTPNPVKTVKRPVYYGGGIGVSLTNRYFAISLRPMLGYKLTPKLSLGVEAMYEYISDSRYSKTYNYSNYGGSVFTRFRVIPSLYLHAEYAMYNYEYRTQFNSEREWIPFLLLGAGYSKRVGRNAYMYVQVLWDVLQDDRSPYKPGEPWVTFGISSGF